MGISGYFIEHLCSSIFETIVLVTVYRLEELSEWEHVADSYEKGRHFGIFKAGSGDTCYWLERRCFMGNLMPLSNMKHGEYDACQCHVIGLNGWDHSDVLGIRFVDTHVCGQTPYSPHMVMAQSISNQSHGTGTSHLCVTLTQQSCGKVIFSYVSVCYSVHRGGGGPCVTITHDPLDFTVQAQPQSWSIQTCLYVWKMGTPSPSPLY